MKKGKKKTLACLTAFLLMLWPCALAWGEKAPDAARRESGSDYGIERSVRYYRDRIECSVSHQEPAVLWAEAVAVQKKTYYPVYIQYEKDLEGPAETQEIRWGERWADAAKIHIHAKNAQTVAKTGMYFLADWWKSSVSD